MVVFSTIDETRKWLAEIREAETTLGFVPTMGALHRGHLDLIRQAGRQNRAVVCSIFVNPIQFNNPEDLEKYPRTLEKDLILLEHEGCDMVFSPSVEEMYPGPVTQKYDFGELEHVMEGKYRPGHFNGVAVVVKKLFDIIGPDKAYFGEKDFQQLRIIQALVRLENIPVEIVPFPTVREADGLAMSSRNMRLNAEERMLAPEIYQTLLQAKEFAGRLSVEEIRNLSAARLEHKGFNVDYFEIADSSTLQAVTSWEQSQEIIACVAAFLGKIRLIDNMILFSNFAG